MSAEGESMRNTKRDEMQIQHLCQIEEHSSCMITVPMAQRQTGFVPLVEVEVEADLALAVLLHHQST
jgi:hypothetical protein